MRAHGIRVSACMGAGTNTARSSNHNITKDNNRGADCSDIIAIEKFVEEEEVEGSLK